MKKRAISIGLAASLIFSPFLSGAKTGNETQKKDKSEAFKVDSKNSVVEWVGKKVTGEHSGTIMISEGAVMVSNGLVSGGNISIDMNSIKCTDMEGEYAGKLEGHLKADDFFGTEKNPASQVEIIKITPIANAKEGEPNYTVKGKFTIKGKTNEIDFPANLVIKGDNLVGIATIDIDRSKFDIKYNSPTFFASIGDKAIYDIFTMKIKLIAKKS